MTYDSFRFNLNAQGIKGSRQWEYTDTGGETGAVFQGAGWFADAKDKGVDTGDRVVVHDTTNNQVYHGTFTTVQDTGATQGTATFDTD